MHLRMFAGSEAGNRTSCTSKFTELFGQRETSVAGNRDARNIAQSKWTDPRRREQEITESFVMSLVCRAEDEAYVRLTHGEALDELGDASVLRDHLPL